MDTIMGPNAGEREENPDGKRRTRGSIIAIVANPPIARIVDPGRHRSSGTDPYPLDDGGSATADDVLWEDVCGGANLLQA